MEFEEVEVNSERWFDLTLLKNEEFRDIKGYEGLYQVSNYGRVKTIKIRNSVNVHNKTKILKQCESKFGYYIVNLSNKSQRVHRLVALTFIPNLKNYYCVNHIDGNKHNNKIDNLEWCTSSYNNYEAYRLGLKQGSLKNKYGKNNPNSKKIIRYDLYKNKIDERKETNVTGAAQPQLPIHIMSKIKLLNPPIELQNEFADFVKLIDKSKFIVQKQIDDLQELLDSKMDEYFG